MPSSALDLLPPTRRALLTAIKERGAAHVETLAGVVFLTPSAVRQHLAALVAQGILIYTVERIGPGRPRHVFEVAPLGETLFPQAYDSYLDIVLSAVEAEAEDVHERVALRMAGLAGALDDSCADGEAGPARVEALLDRYARFGFLPELRSGSTGDLHLRLQCCPLQRLVAKHPLICAAERRCMEEALGREVGVEAHRLSGDACCEYTFAAVESNGHKG